MQQYDSVILGFIKKVRLRFFWCGFFSSIWQSFIATIILDLILELLSRIFPIYYKSQMQISIFILGFLVYAVLQVYKMPSEQKAAMMFDSLGFNERLTTSLELMKREDDIAIFQKRTTAELVEGINIKKLIKPGFYINGWVGVFCLFVAFSILCSLPNPKQIQAKYLHGLSTIKKKQMLQLKKQQKVILTQKGLSSVQKRKLVELLSKLRREIKLAKSEKEIELAKQKALFLLDDAKKETDMSSKLFLSAIDSLKNAIDKQEEKKQLKLSSKSYNFDNGEITSSKMMNGSQSDNNKENSELVSKNKSKGLNGNISLNKDSKGNDSDKTNSQNNLDSKNVNQSGNLQRNDLNSGGDNFRKESSSNGSGRGNGENDSALQRGGGLGATVPRQVQKVSAPSVYTKKLALIEPKKNVSLSVVKDKTGTEQVEGAGERGQKMSFESALSYYQKEANEYIEAEEIPSWAKDIAKRYFESLESLR